MRYLDYSIPRLPKAKRRGRIWKSPPKVEGFDHHKPPKHVIRQSEFARIYSVPSTLVTLLIDTGFFKDDEILRDCKNSRWIVMKRSTSTKGRRLRDMLKNLR